MWGTMIVVCEPNATKSMHILFNKLYHLTTKEHYTSIASYMQNIKFNIVR
jgi:hypothetical protein